MDKKSKYETLIGISFIVFGLVAGGVLTLLVPAVPVMAGAAVGGVFAASVAQDAAENFVELPSKTSKATNKIVGFISKTLKATKKKIVGFISKTSKVPEKTSNANNQNDTQFLPKITNEYSNIINNPNQPNYYRQRNEIKIG